MQVQQFKKKKKKFDSVPEPELLGPQDQIIIAALVAPDTNLTVDFDFPCTSWDLKLAVLQQVSTFLDCT